MQLHLEATRVIAFVFTGAVQDGHGEPLVLGTGAPLPPQASLHRVRPRGQLGRVSYHWSSLSPVCCCLKRWQGADGQQAPHCPEPGDIDLQPFKNQSYVRCQTIGFFHIHMQKLAQESLKQSGWEA